jgi:hypothetical protein
MELDRLAVRATHEREKIVGGLRQRVERQAQQVARVHARAEAHGHQMEQVLANLAQLRKLVRKSGTSSQRARRLLTSQLDETPLALERLQRIAEGSRPILVGPWTGEVGYEVLYWIPFVHWFVQTFEIDPDRVCVMSRGGPVSWYRGIGSRYVDILSLLSPDEFRDHPGRSAWMKQDVLSAFDRHVLRRARAAVGRPRARLLHPMLMFRMFKGFWGGRVSLKDVLRYTSHHRLTPPDPLPGLPERYVAVRFYFRTSFPDTPANRAFVARTLAVLTRQSDVVLLNPGFRIDDHCDYAADGQHRVHTIDHLLTPERNLDVQTAVLARADAFVGNYGGFAYLAPLLGVESVTFYSTPSFKVSHLELAQHVIDQVGGASLSVLDTADLDVLGRALRASDPHRA